MAEIVDAELAVQTTGSGFSVSISVDKGRDSRRKYGPFPAPLDLERLRTLSGEAGAYGKALAEMLFDSDELREVLSGARWAAEERGVPLRLRLWLAGDGAALHALRWELLTLPGRPEPLCTREDILFSRFLPANQDAAQPRPRGALRALAAFASPSDLPGSLAPIDVPRWKEEARAGLAGMEVDWLPGDETERCTLDRLAQRIYGKDVLFLVCHGKVIRGEGWLVLENPDGTHARVPAADLTRRLAGARGLPRLAVLVVCESAGASGMLPADAETVGAVGPLLVEAGIPAVVAMQDGLTFESAGQLLPMLFGALQEDGVIDRAVSVGRRAILGRPDESAPVLFMSLVSGRLWQVEADPTEQADKPVVQPDATAPGTARPRKPAAEVSQQVLYAALSGEAFEMEDLRALCFVLGVDWDNLRGETKSAKAMAMIRYFASRGLYAKLVESTREARPNLEL